MANRQRASRTFPQSPVDRHASRVAQTSVWDLRTEVRTTKHHLKQEVPSWKSPDYPEVRRRVHSACGTFRKDDVVEVCRGFLGKAHSGKSKVDLLEALAQPMIRQLEIRFMNAGA